MGRSHFNMWQDYIFFWKERKKYFPSVSRFQREGTRTSTRASVAGKPKYAHHKFPLRLI